MTEYIKLILIISLFPVIIYSQTGIIKGNVIGVNEESLLGANVYLIGTEFGCATDNNGKYKIVNITPGKYIIRCTYIGYKAEQQHIDVKKCEEIVVDFKLTETEINAIIIKDKKLIITIPPTIPPTTSPPIRPAELLPLYKLENIKIKLLKKNCNK